MSTASGRGVTSTSASSEDARLRGRTCAVPFEQVWQAARNLAGGGLRGWSLRSADDTEGVIRAYVKSLRGAEHDVLIRISLDQNAQTRVDASATSLKPATDFGASTRRIITFFKALDAALARAPRRGTATLGT